MGFDLDAALLDSVFQPAADRIAPKVSCFGLSRICLGIAIGMQFVVLAFDLSAEADPVQRLFSCGITVIALGGGAQARHLISRVERQSRPGVANARRVTMRWQRVAWLLVTVLALAVAANSATGADTALVLASAGWLGCLYFIACTPSPPAVRLIRRLVPVTGRS